MPMHAPIQWPAVPKVTVSEHGVTCEDCQRTFRAAGNHFKAIHKMPKQPRVSDRLRLFGLYKGERLAARSYRETHRDLAARFDRRAIGKALYAKLLANGAHRTSGNAGLKSSPELRAAYGITNRPQLERAKRSQIFRGRVVMTCEGCGFTSTQTRELVERGRRHCSWACYKAVLREPVIACRRGHARYYVRPDGTRACRDCAATAARNRRAAKKVEAEP